MAKTLFYREEVFMENNPHFYLNHIPEGKFCPECKKSKHEVGCSFVFEEARITDIEAYVKDIASKFFSAGKLN